MHADAILGVEGGEMSSAGRHDDLLRARTLRSFFRLQHRDATPPRWLRSAQRLSFERTTLPKT